jgi:hypothetical protein
MQIVFTKKVADELREKYTVLELEPIPVEKENSEVEFVDAYCVIPAEQIIMEIASLQDNIALHEQFVQGLKDNNTGLCLTLSGRLLGKFGGALDSFYSIMASRINKTNSTAFNRDITE